MGFALIGVVVGCGLCGTCRRVYTCFSAGYERDIRLNTFVSFLLLQVTVKVRERKRLKQSGITRMWRVKRK